MKIAMTAPVLSKVEPGQGPACTSNLTRSFFLSDKLATPPKPTDPSVYLTELPGFVAYVR